MARESRTAPSRPSWRTPLYGLRDLRSVAEGGGAARSVDDFTRAQLEVRARRGASRSDQASRERAWMSSRRSYLLRGMVRCAVCGRKMEGGTRRHATFYCCTARSLVPGSPAAGRHPPNVYLREDGPSLPHLQESHTCSYDVIPRSQRSEGEGYPHQAIVRACGVAALLRVVDQLATPSVEAGGTTGQACHARLVADCA